MLHKGLCFRIPLPLFITKSTRTTTELATESNNIQSSITLDDIFISVKTTKKNEKNRLTAILTTWYQLAKHQTWFFSDAKPTKTFFHNESFTNQHIINTNCADSHSREDLCCKTSVEFDFFIKSNKKWFCQFDDDNYVNVPRLVQVLRGYDHNQDWYLGRASENFKAKVKISVQASVFYRFKFATFGAGMCITRTLALKMVPHVFGGKLISICCLMKCADDVAFGFVIVQLLNQRLTEVERFHSHIEKLSKIPPNLIHEQISFSYLNDNVIDIAGFDKDSDPTRFLSLHCYLFPNVPFCPTKSVPTEALFLRPTQTTYKPNVNHDNKMFLETSSKYTNVV